MSVAEEVFVLMGSDAVIGASLPARTLLSLSRMENGEVVETVSDEYYSFEGEKIVLVNEYLKKFADGKFDFRVTAERYDGSYETSGFHPYPRQLLRPKALILKWSNRKGAAFTLLRPARKARFSLLRKMTAVMC